MSSFLRSAVKKSYPLTAFYYLLDDLRSRMRFARGDIDTDSGMAHGHGNLQKSIDYIEEVFRDYKFYAGIAHFHGRIAEVGPGDSCGVALLFLADGCEFVDLADRFYSRRDIEYHAKIYRALVERYPRLNVYLGAADLSDERTFIGLMRHQGAGAAAETFFDIHRGYDFIVSRAVLEHVYDPLLALAHMTSALDPGGMLLHKVDLRDHGMFSSNHHELKYFEVPDSVYPFLTRASGRPNRILLDRYREVLSKMPVDYRLLITRLAGVGDIEPHLPYEEIDPVLRLESLRYVRSVRNQFARSLRKVSDEDLSVAGFFLIAKKINAG